MIKSVTTSAVPALLAAIIVAATWLPTVGAPAHPFTEQTYQA